MESFLDLFGLRRRQALRVAVNWLVDVQVQGTDHFVGFYAYDVGVAGLRLQGHTLDAFERVISADGTARMRLRVPDPQDVLEVEAGFKWEREEEGKAISGWSFSGLSRSVRKALEDYIRAHPEDIIETPAKE